MVVNIQFYCLPVSRLLAWQSMAICHYAWPFVCPSFCLPLCHLLAWLSVWLTGHINPVTNSDSCLCLFVIASVCLFMSVGLPVIFVEVCLVLKSIWMSCLLQSIPLPPSFLPSVSPPPPPLQPSIDHFLILHCVPEPSQQPAPVYRPLSPTSMDISWSPPDYPNGVIVQYRLFRNDTLVFEDNGEPALEDF